MLRIFRKWLNSLSPNRRSRYRRSQLCFFRADIQILEPRALLSASFPAFVDPHPSAGDGFGAEVVPLKNGNFVVTSPNDNAGGTDAGALYLFNGSTGTLISTLIGTHTGDFTDCNITQLENNNFVVANDNWDLGRGAVTWGNGITGVSGTIAASNSLTGSNVGDKVGIGGIIVLPDGNYLVDSYNWANGLATKAGAVTFGEGGAGVSGTVSAANSLVGSTSGDEVGADLEGRYPYSPGNLKSDVITIPFTTATITILTNGNYAVSSALWNHSAGAVTFGSGKTGVAGVVGASNSLVGSHAGDGIGAARVVALGNGNYVVNSPSWANGTAKDAGAVTWASGTIGVHGAVSASNSLIGVAAGDGIGRSGIVVLTNGNYVIDSPSWANGTVANAGAVTWGSGVTGVHGVVSDSNSLVGSATNDSIGWNGVVALANGNYLVDSPLWNNGAATDAGAVTFGNGTNGVTGLVSAKNSLVGNETNDLVGGAIPFGVVVSFNASSSDQMNPAATNTITYSSIGEIKILGDGSYLVMSEDWNNGTATKAGAITWGSATKGVAGVVSAANSLVGGSTGDEIGNGSESIIRLSSGSFLVSSPNWSNGSATNAGAVTFVHDVTDFKGLVSPTNSLVGSSTNDFVGDWGITMLSNGNYIVHSPDWGSGAGSSEFGFSGVGAMTWGNGKTGIVGAVSATNSLVGSIAGDSVGISIVLLSDGNFVDDTSYWHGGTGAVTWGSASKGVTGVVSATNSLTGSSRGDSVGYGIQVLSNGNYVVLSPFWSNGSVQRAGAATWGSGATGVSGLVSAANSLVGSKNGDEIGSEIIELSNGNYVTASPFWNSVSETHAGAVTFGNGLTGVVGVVSAANSLVGSSEDDMVGYYGLCALPNGNYVVDSQYWANGTTTEAGAITFGNGVTGVTGVISAKNSLVGNTAYGNVGSDGITILPNGNYVVDSPNWANGANLNAGAVTFGSEVTGISGVVASSNSLVGNISNQGVGEGRITVLSNGNYLVINPTVPPTAAQTTGIPGSVTFGSATNGVSGVVSSANSFVAGPMTNVSTAFYYDPVTFPTTPANTFVVPFPESGQVFIGSTITGIPKPTPTLFDVNPTPLNYVTNSGPTTIVSTIQASDPNGSILNSATITISKNYHNGQDHLTFSNTASITGSWNAATGTLTLKGVDTVANYAAALASVTYGNTSSSPNTSTRTVQFTTTDGTTTSNTVSRTISIEVPPSVSGIETSSLSYKRTNPAVSITSSLKLTDAESSTLAGAVIQITNPQAGDVLLFANTSKIKGTWNASNGTLTLSGIDSIADYQVALRSVKFRNLSATASKVDRIVSFTVNDGLLNSNVDTRTIKVS